MYLCESNENENHQYYHKMKKYANRFLAMLFAVLLWIPVASAQQQMPPIPVDGNVRIGKLDNGLTYYIRHNEYPKGLADFYIAQKVGSIQEEDNQRGLAHFLEHMCFNGTKNFPGNSLISWLESIGVKFGQNLNAYTSIDETVYNISQVPVAREAVADSCLLILHDWANELLLEDEEIDKERGVIHEEWRSRNVGSQRIIEQLLPVLYPGDKYAYRMPIGTMEIVDNFPYQDLRDYYEKWYRPDLQAIIVVGDIDVDVIEGKIKSMFSDIEMPAGAAKREYYPVADNAETIFAIGKDKEMPNAMINILFKHDATPDSAKLTLDYMLQDYAMSMIVAMLNERFQEMSSKPDSPFAAAQSGYGEYLVSKTKDAFEVLGVPKGHDIMPVFESIYREALRAKRGGFTASEYGRVRQEYLSRLEKAYNNRATTPSTALVEEYVDHFLDNEPIPGIENEYQIMSMLANSVPVEALNAVMGELMPDSNVVVLGMFPDNAETVVPTAEQLAEAMKRVEAENIEGYVDDVKTEPLIETLPAPGKIVATAHDGIFDAEVWTLSNGVKVVVKPTDFKENEVLFAARAIGGTSEYGPEYDVDLRYLPYAMSQSGLGSYTANDLQKYLSGKQASVDFSMDSYVRDMTGSAVTKDLPTLMELIYMTFTDFNITEEDYASARGTYAGILRNQESTPQFVFTKHLREFIYNSPRFYTVDVATVENADRGKILDIIHEQLANAAEYTFYFVGKFDVDSLRPLVEQYIATLPARKVEPKAVEYKNLGLKLGAATEKSSTAMDVPQTYAGIFLLGDMPYSSANAKIASMAGQILTARLLEKVREDEGATYSISASGSMSRMGEVPVIFQSVFPMKPEMRDKVLAIVADEFDAMATEIKPEELSKVKEFMVKNANRNLKENGSWLSAMEGYQLKPVDGFLNAVDEINAITAADITAFMGELLKQNNYRVFVLDPEEKK